MYVPGVGEIEIIHQPCFLKTARLVVLVSQLTPSVGTAVTSFTWFMKPLQGRISLNG